MLIPLGLGHKTPRPAVVTFALVALTILAMFVQPDLNKLVKVQLKLHSDLALKRKAKALFFEFCYRNGGEKKKCVEYSSLATIDFFSEGESIAELLKERARATELRTKLEKVKRHERDYRYLVIVSAFLRNLKKPTPQFISMRQYRSFAHARSELRRKLTQDHARDNILSPVNPTALAAFLSIFRHAGFLHIFGNMLFLLAFGRYVESRLDSAGYLGLYLAGGVVAAYTHIFMSAGAQTTPLVGASGAIATVMGLFVVFFWDTDMRLFIPLPFGRPTMRLPVKYAVPFLYLGSDLVGTFSTTHDFSALSNVGHWAHLGGFAFGVVAGGVINELFPLAWPTLYYQEARDFSKLARMPKVKQKLLAANTVVEYNPNNLATVVHTIMFIAKRKPTEDSVAFIQEHLQSTCAMLLRKGQYDTALSILHELPREIPLNLFLNRLGQINTLLLADYALHRRLPLLSLRLYDSYLHRFEKSRQVPFVMKSVESLCQAFPNEERWLKELASLLKDADLKVIGSAIAARLSIVPNNGEKIAG